MKDIISILLTLLSLACYPEVTTPIFKQYDANKVGAEILASYDLSDIYSPASIDNKLHFTQYNNKFYIVHNEKIFIFDKYSIQKIADISYSITNLYPEFSSYLNDRFYNEDISVCYNIILFSYNISIKNLNLLNKRFLFKIDLSGDNFKKLDLTNDFNIAYFSGEIGNNVFSSSLWIKSGLDIYNYSYDSTNDKYLIEGLWGKIDSTWTTEIFNIYKEDIWFCYEPNACSGEVYIEKRNKNNPVEILKKIDVNYLGTLSTPEDILFDGEFLWIIIYKDGKMQLLKLRPL